MNKLGLVLSLAAVAAVSGCLDPQYKSKRTANEGTTIAKPVEPVKPVEVTPPPAKIEVVDQPVVKPVDVKPVDVKPVAKEPQFTTYIIQRGDTLSKISKRYNIKIEAIKSNNPQIKNDVVRLGQKIKLPGNVDVGDQTIPEGSFATDSVKTTATAKAAKAPFKPYIGPTKVYVVKNGDTLGKVAINSGLSVRQLKDLNGMTKDVIRVGQKLKVPASKVEKPVKAEPKTEVKKVSKPAKAEKPAVKAPAVSEEAVSAPVENSVQSDEAAVKDVVTTPTAPASNAKFTSYTVVDGDDLIGISIRENLSVAEIRELNNIPPDEDVKPGMVIKLPVPAL